MPRNIELNRILFYSLLKSKNLLTKSYSERIPLSKNLLMVRNTCSSRNFLSALFGFSWIFWRIFCLLFK